MKVFKLRPGTVCVLLLVCANSLSGCDRESKTSEKAERASVGPVQAAQASCANKPNVAECLIGEANRTEPADMQICAAAAKALPCSQSPNSFDVCPAPAADADGRCKIVFD